MCRFIKYCKVKLAEKIGALGVTAIALWVWCAAIYALGLIDQPELVSYVEDGYFYGYYNFNMYPMRLIAWATAAIVSLFYSSMAFAQFFDRRGAAFNIMLPSTRSQKFLYAALLNLIAIPLMLSAVVYANDYVWSYFLEIASATQEVPWLRISILVVSFITLNTMLLCMGVLFKRFQWVWGLGLCLLMSTAFYLYITLGDRGVRNEFELNLDNPHILLIIEALVAILWVGVAWLRFGKIELKG